MTFDLTTLPDSIDGIHFLLAVLALVFLFLYLSGRGRQIPEARPAIPAGSSGEASEPEMEQVAAKLREAAPDAALQLLSLLQQEARFIDFLQEDLTGFSDADVGSAARVVHGGGQKVLGDYFVLAPVRNEEEESRIDLPAGFDASEVRLTGRVVGQPPFSGTLVHRGWRVLEVRLPKLAEGHDPGIIAPAEVEL